MVSSEAVRVNIAGKVLHSHVVPKSIHLVQVIQTEDEDWSTITDAATRRKLQNRLNKRISRQRKLQSESSPSEIRLTTFAEAYERLGQKVLFKPKTDWHMKSHEPAFFQPKEKSKSATFPKSFQSGQVVHRLSIADFGRDFVSCHQSNIASSPDFRTYVTRTSTFPLSVDHALLTLMHFNLIRALTQNIESLGIEPEWMIDDDSISPWNSSQYSSLSAKLAAVPPGLRPTSAQLTIPHHPEIDILPFPVYRDNILLAGDEIDDVELCHDMVFGIDPNKEGVPKACLDTSFVGDRTGFIIWSDPGLEASWEVDELFLRKWKKLFKGCHGILQSTNRWREGRGELPLVLEQL